MEHPAGAFKVNSACVVRAVKETDRPDRALPPIRKPKRSKFVQEI